MKRPLALGIVVIAVLAAAYVGYRVLWPSQEDQLRGALAALAATVSVPEQEGDLPRLARVQQAKNYLVEDLLVEVEDGPVMGGREAVLGALAAAKVRGPARVRFTDVSVRLQGDERSASVTATVEIEQPDPRSGTPSVDAREVDMTWVRPDNSWVLQRARLVRALR